MSQAGAAPQAQGLAAGSSFYLGMRVLPKRRREAMYAVYAFCRAVDDIADDETASRESRRAALGAWAARIDELYAGGSPPEAGYLKAPIDRFDLRRQDFLDVVDGMRMDADAKIVAPPLETLDLYCDRVASAVGRLSVRIFGMEEDPGLRLAFHLGRALQLTNILRDLDEDAGVGRLYLAEQWLVEAGAPTSDPQAALAHPGLDAAARQAAREAHRHYARAEETLRSRPRGRLAAPRLMSGVYGGILEAMEKEGWAAPRRRIKLSKSKLLRIGLFRGLLGL